MLFSFAFTACGSDKNDVPEDGISYEQIPDGSKSISVSFYVDGDCYHCVKISGTQQENIFPDEPQKDGCYFMGWYLDKDAWQIPFINLELLWLGTLFGDVSVYAKFEESAGLIINQIYGLGDKSDDGQAGSHSFIEIYNRNDFPVSLDGYSVQSATNGTAWQKLDLQGIIPSQSSFLIILNKYTNISAARLLITEYDMLWQDAYFPNKDLKVALIKNTQLLTVANPFDSSGRGAVISGYVDMIGIAGNDIGRSIDGYETDYLGGGETKSQADTGQSKQKSARRIDLQDTDNNAADVETIDYRTADLKYRPRHSAFGLWTGVEDEGIFFDPFDFPTLHVDTENAVGITSKEIYTSAVVSLRNANTGFTFENIGAGIRGRGNFTWKIDKKPYRLRFNTARSMLDSGYQARDWTLIACHTDKSFIRQYSAYHLASLLDSMYFVPNAWFIDLYLNGKYQGVYMLSDQIQQNEGRAELTYDADPVNCEYLLEWDGYAPDEGIEDVDWVSVNGIPVAIKFPSGSSLTSAHISYVKDYLIVADNAFESGNYAEILDIICENSFIDYFLVEELFKNSDCGWSSIYMQIKGSGAERGLQMGPVWDFDLALGNTEQIYSEPDGLWAEIANRWFGNLMQVQEFRNNFIARWNEVKDAQIDEMITRTEGVISIYREAFERNFMVWDILGSYFWPNPPAIIEIDTFIGQAEYAINYLKTRKIWLDNYYNG